LLLLLDMVLLPRPSNRLTTYLTHLYLHTETDVHYLDSRRAANSTFAFLSIFLSIRVDTFIHKIGAHLIFGHETLKNVTF
jgi:hypothetical protein